VGQDEGLRRRFLKAEKIERRNLSRVSDRRVDWKTTHCIFCQRRVEFSPKRKNWNRKLLCPHCGRVFEVPSLDGFFHV